METYEAVLAELEEMRTGAASLLRAKLEAMASQVREHASRVAGDLGAVVPPDLEALWPLGSLAERLQALAVPPPAPAPVTALDLDTLRALDAGRAQSEVLQELLRRLEPWCGPRAIAVFRDGTVQGWSTAGFAEGNPARGWHAAIADSPALEKAAAGTPALVDLRGDRLLAGWFGGDEHQLLLVPMSLRARIVGVLLARAGESGLNGAMVQQLTYTVGLMLETLATRPVAPTPALAPAEVIGAQAVVAPVAPPAAAPPVTVAAPVAEPPAVAVAAATTPTAAAVAPPEPAAVAAVEVAAVAAPAAAAAIPEIGGETVELKVPVTPAAAVARTPEEERKHDEARRFARLLVSEIRLYNEPAVQAGKLSHDIYARLRDDINRSREMYEQRVSPEVRAQSDYFNDEMVRILADGDPDALGS